MIVYITSLKFDLGKNFISVNKYHTHFGHI